MDAEYRSVKIKKKRKCVFTFKGLVSLNLNYFRLLKQRKNLEVNFILPQNLKMISSPGEGHIRKLKAVLKECQSVREQFIKGYFHIP